jgi:hypothetical protein
MRIDWVPYSAAALVLGATALSIGSVLLPSGGGAAATMEMASEKGGQWFAVAGLYFLASVALTIGMPSVVTLFLTQGAKLGLAAVGVFTVGCVGIAGLAMLLVFIRSLALTPEFSSDMLTEVTSEVGLTVFLFAWIGAFYLGELLLGIALLRSRVTHKWVPGLLLLHVALFPLSLVAPELLPDRVQSMTVLLLTVGLCGVGIAANQYAARRALI